MSTEENDLGDLTTNYVPVQFTQYLDGEGAMVAIMGEFPTRTMLFLTTPEHRGDKAMQEILRAMVLDYCQKEHLSPKQKLGVMFRDHPIMLADLPADPKDRACALAARLIPEGTRFEFQFGLPEFPGVQS